MRNVSLVVDETLSWMEKHGSTRTRDGMARFGIVADKAFGISVSALQQLGKRLGKDHDVALALWETGWYEARMLSAFVDEPDRVTQRQMDRWAKDFDNWAVCDHVCFHLFDRTPHAWKKIDQWGDRREEFVKRAAFALIAGLWLHDKAAADKAFLHTLPLIERAASDDRNFVRKGVSWALRGLGRRNLKLNAAALGVARRLADSGDSSARWVGKDAVRELSSAKVQQLLARRAKRPVS